MTINTSLKTCWLKTPGRCIQQDDMTEELFDRLLQADLIPEGPVVEPEDVDAEHVELKDLASRLVDRKPVRHDVVEDVLQLGIDTAVEPTLHIRHRFVVLGLMQKISTRSPNSVVTRNDRARSM